MTCLLEGNGADCIVHCDESDKLRRGVLKSTKKFAVVNCRLRIPCDITHFLVPRAGNRESGFREPDTSQVVIANLLRSIVVRNS
ncbi:hypothetical protein T03_17828 [Trichinella britovi]|uniref:Uncharacterized protein n=2 Tax=Trichinella britovi TaxID=45882 RepID=A0A0V1C5V0_TRIBR|nr:hypothetical protein T03_17828 [Trichinella britovi]